MSAILNLVVVDSAESLHTAACLFLPLDAKFEGLPVADFHSQHDFVVGELLKELRYQTEGERYFFLMPRRIEVSPENIRLLDYSGEIPKHFDRVALITANNVAVAHSRPKTGPDWKFTAMLIAEDKRKKEIQNVR